MNVLNELNRLQKLGIISLLEVEYVRYLHHINSEERDGVLWAAAACIFAQRKGHVCFDFSEQTDKYLFNDKKSGIHLSTLVLKNWRDKLIQSELVGSGKTLTPLVLEEDRLYLHRYWSYEEELASWLVNKSKEIHEIQESDLKVIKSIIKPSPDLFETDWQHVAVYQSFVKDLLIISGGPGTGKTHTVLSILASQVLAHEDDLRIALAAPTGKAARRLTDSIQQGKHTVSSEAIEKLNSVEDAVTVHKLLGADFSGNRFKFNDSNKLPYDLIVVDEASMLDITMWIRLIRAIGENTKLIILGDKDQLASVEAGSILGDICRGENTFSEYVADSINKAFGYQVPNSNQKPDINDCILFLTKSYRFGENSGIQKFSEAVNTSNDDKAIDILNDPDYNDIKWVIPNEKGIRQVIDEYAVSHFDDYSEKQERQLLAVNNKKILCSVRNGPFGVSRINQIAEQRIRRRIGVGFRNEWYSGRLVMATKNNSVLKIRNGEMGICFSEKDSKIMFEDEQKRVISASRLNDYEPAYAITIHKSQGSEFEDVAIILSGSVKTILSKEILYTSVTRARKNTLVIATEEVLRSAIRHSVTRNSGLQHKIWGSVYL